MRITALVLSAVLLTVPAGAQALKLDQLQKGQKSNGFTVDALYVNAADKPVGARFMHDRTGFTLDYLEIESVPQGYTWVNTFAVGDQGEAHTQEHLLLGKGTTGRSFAGLDVMWLARSNAFAQQWRTSYNFNTTAGPTVFFDLLSAQLNALLHPNYSDDEIRREVRNWGVTEAPDKTLGLEEKGSVFNEMVSSTTNRFRVVNRVMNHQLYGTNHPMAFNSGGEPSGIRTMKAEDIRRYHAANYYLGNMGTIVALSRTVPLADALANVDSILSRVEPGDSKRPSARTRPLPPPASAPAGSISVGEYPTKNDQQPSPLRFAWPATLDLSADDMVLAQTFLTTFAGDATTNLYKVFIDSKTRSMDIGATSVYGTISTNQGNPISIGLNDVAIQHLTPERIAEIRSRVVAELAKVAEMPDGSPELTRFNERAASRLIEAEREFSNLINTPPAFGARNTGSTWMDQFLFLEKVPGFRKSVTLSPQIAALRKQLASGKNIWRDAIQRWKLTTVVPYAAAAKPSPALLAREDAERVQRAQAEAKRLAAQYGVADEQAAIRRYRAEEDAISARIEEEAKKIAPAKFVSTPPMTLDDPLRYTTAKLESGVPIVTSTFDNMTSATLGVAVRADRLPLQQIRFLSLMPALLTQVGVIENGKPVSYEQMSERLRREVLALNAYYSSNPRTGRLELVMRGSGLGAAESKRAIEWMTLALQHPDWRPENLPRIRDVVDQSLSSLRNTMMGQEEQWVQNPALAWRMQMNPSFLASTSFLTRAHYVLRLRWMLKEVPAGSEGAVTAFFNRLIISKDMSREELKKLVTSLDLSGLPAAVQPLAKDALTDLDLTLVEIPDSSLAEDWLYLVTTMRNDLLIPPAQVLAALDATRRELLRRDGARMFFVTSSDMQKTLAPDVNKLAATLDPSPAPAVAPNTTPIIEARLQQRDPSAQDPVHVGLLAPNMKGGVIITSVPGVHVAEHTNREKQKDYLASRLFGGAGAHSLFLKTLAAGLAYSNGPSASPINGRMGYYAERTPEIPQTVKFVIDAVKNGQRDTGLVDYTIAQVFGETRAADTYESRAEGIAADLADGQPPEMVRKFRESILELRKDPKLGDQLFDRKDAVYGRTMPGFNVKAKDVADGVFFAIGPDRQLDAWATYLRGAEGETTRMDKLYPRDFWMP